jgi:hypothetical protein
LNDLVLPVAATLAALAFAAPATAAVVPGHGIADVELRMTEAQVRAVVGPPLSVTRCCGSGDRNKPLARVTIYWIGAQDRVTRIVVGFVV